MIKAIVAVDENNGIGVGENLAFRNKLDQAFFSGYTMGETVLVGHNTYSQIKHLKGREIVIDERGKNLCTKLNCDFIVIGGAKTYIKYAPFVREALITFFDESNPECDKFLNVSEVFEHLTNKEVVFNGSNFRIERWTK